MQRSGSRVAIAAFALLTVSLASMSRGMTAHADTGLTVSVIDGVHADAYPSMEADLSIVDPANGQLLTTVAPGDVTLTDDSGAARVTSVVAKPSTAVPTAYVLLFDTSGGMQPYLSRAQQIASQFIAKLGPRDVVRVVSFNTGTNESSTTWWIHDDPNLSAAISALTTSSKVALVNDAMTRAAIVANTAPAGITRKAVVAFLTIDGARAERQLSAEDVKNRFPPTTFSIGFGTPPADDQGLPQFLDSLGKYSGGAYWLFGSPTYPPDPVAATLDVTQRTWAVKFVADGLPDGKSHPLTITVKAADQRSGSVAANYTSAGLLSVTPVVVQGLKQGDSVDADRDLVVSLGGQKTWSSTQIELFSDCDPGGCGAAATSNGAPVTWKLASAPLSQGDHRLAIRVTASDGQRQFSGTQTITYSRSGTSFNLGVLFLFLGAGGIAIVATAVVIRRRAPTHGW